MKSGFTLSVPSPCSEDWNSFTPTETGGFCGRCQKNVIDFTNATDDEIIAFISKKPKHACGRFKSSQLKTYTIFPAEKVTPGFMLLKAGAAGLLLLLISKPASAQVQMTKPLVETHQTTDVSKEQTHSSKIVVRGRVVSAEDNSALPGISVVQRGTSSETQTDGDGMFELNVDLSEGDTLVFSFIGLESKEFKISRNTPPLSITMKPDLSTLQEVVVVAGGVTIGRHELTNTTAHSQSGLRKLWRKIRSWF